MRSSALARQLAGLEGFDSPRAALEQVATPSSAAALLLDRARALGDIEGRQVVDLGCGTGVLAIGAALLGAARVTGVDADEQALAVARRNAGRAGVTIELLHAEVRDFTGRADTVVMNPPFGAQRAHADRPFWATAFALRPRRLYAFALAASRTFIADAAVAANARVVSRTEPVPWDLPRTFPHHQSVVELPVDLWVLATAPHER